LAGPSISKNSNETMSHFTTIKTQIKDIEALRLACQEMGVSLLQNAEARGYYENRIKGGYVILANLGSNSEMTLARRGQWHKLWHK
jgi:hypothetical protein